MNKTSMDRGRVALNERYMLGVEEAADYYRIGRKRLYELASENPDADFFLMIGNRIHIKRKKFEDYLDEISIL